MATNSLLSCNSVSSGLTLMSPALPSCFHISRRALLFQSISMSKPPVLLNRTSLLTIEMSSTNKSAPEPSAEEDAKRISRGEKTLASTENTSTWAKSALGTIVLFALPILRKFHSIKDVTKSVEEVVEVVEQAAEVTEKVAEELAEALPEGGLKEVAVKLDKIALLVDKEAEFTESIIDKVDHVVEEVNANLKLVEAENKKNDEEDKKTITKIVADQST